MKINKDNKYETRGGKEVMIYHIMDSDYDYEDEMVHGAIKRAYGYWDSMTWFIDGSYYGHGRGSHVLDLIPKKTPEEKYQEGQGNCGIIKGDWVKVTKKADNYQDGWTTVWLNIMNNYVGKTYKVDRVSSYGICLNIGGEEFHLPYFVLEKVDAPTKEMTVAEISKKLGYDIKIIKWVKK